MKIWIKVLAAAIIGVLLGIFLPDDSARTAKALASISDIVIHIGRYLLFPLMFFSLAHGVYELRLEKQTFRLFLRTFAYLIASTLLLVVIGILAILLLSPQRIPITIEQEPPLIIPSLKETLLGIFPANLFALFALDGSNLLPLAFLAFFIGINASFDRTVTRPVTQLFDSPPLFYHMNSIITEFSSILCIVLAANLTVKTISAPEISLFTQIIVILLAVSGVVILGFYPLILYLFGGKENPYRWLYAQIAPACTGFLSGDSYFSYSMLVRHGKENLGIPRKAGSVTFTAFTFFGKGGTALVSAASFLVIIKSYSSLGITIPQILWILVFAFLLSFITGPFPGAGVIVAVSALCGLYGRGLEEGYLILKPIFPLLMSFGVLLDVVTASCVSLLVAKHEKMTQPVHTSDFI
jgi:Na+/H+-dicarboxylate symporter